MSETLSRNGTHHDATLTYR